MLKKLKQNKLALGIGIFFFLFCIIGLSYAYWQLTIKQTGTNKLATSCFDISFKEESEAINLAKAYPITDEEGMQTTPYEFTITNTCDTFISYDVILGVLANEDPTTDMNASYIAAVIDRGAVQTLNTYESTTVDGYKEAYILQTGSLSPTDEVSYSLRLWMDEDVTATEDSINKNFLSKVVVRATVSNYSPVEQGFDTLAEAMLVNEYQSSSVASAKQQIEAKQAPDFTQTAPIIIWSESHASTTTTASVMMPHPDLVGNGESYSAGLTAQNVLPRIGTSYTFNSETGQYTIGNPQYLDPTTLDYNGETTYYFCSAGFNTNSSDRITPYQNTSCTTMYRIVSVSGSDGTTTGSGGTSIKTKIYRMTAYAYTQSEQESDKSDRGLYMMEDQDGKSYYYRGSVSNNYVQFAGYYWRIIRQNGDGSVRLLYAGTSAKATGSGLQIKTNAFNSTRTNPGYVGYMYGNTFNSSYAETHANENDSSIKTQLDSWYKTNIVDKGYSEYIADSGFCNDRSLDSGSDGVSTTADTYFKGYRRYVNHEPSLICPNASNDLFTVSNEDGNQALTYPIGLITVDELMLGGLADGYLNRLSYTYSSSSYWTMSPRFFIATYTSAYVFFANSAGFATNAWVTDTYGVRAVINLKADTPITGGIGTANDPFVVG